MRRRIHVGGVVQGVGFRPFVYQIATRAHLRGWVMNTSAGVEIEVEGDPDALDAFVHALVAEKPPLARIDFLEAHDCSTDGDAPYETFEIRASVAQEGAFQPISPDMAICDDCLRELFDPNDRRYRYPFINCTNCGPRFTIICDIPYDRPHTTMSRFPMCEDCAHEYHDPTNRRFHAQPVACPKCGPQVWLEIGAEGGRREAEGDEAIRAAQELLKKGKIVAVKGLGGFHLACDATNGRAVQTLRERKLRVDKPFALMMRDLETIEQHCWVNAAERELLTSRERPIVLLERRPESNVAREVAPGQNTLGVMLPYTPLHYLILADDSMPSAIVLTSGNLSEEPIAYKNAEARERLINLADAFLMHDRDIHIRTDDSVVRIGLAFPPDKREVKRCSGGASVSARVYPLRRSRGYAPFPVRLPLATPPLLAVGAELKNTFCVTRERYAFMSHHIGDLENYETLRSFEEGIAHFEKLFRIEPQLVAYDLHPNYLATRYALARAQGEGLRAIGVQHHHAHIAACMAENGLSAEGAVIGVAFDGTGYGDDGAIWGGEFLIATYAGYRRAAHLAYVPLPGGDRATREPWRCALTWLHRAGIEWHTDLPPVGAASAELGRIVRRQIERGIHAPHTSSMGRLFDAVAALAGVRQTVNYEAQAAMELEACVDQHEPRAYEFALGETARQGGEQSRSGGAPLLIEAAPVIRAVVADVRAGVSIPVIAARFHNGVARMVREVAHRLRAQYGLNEVALSGGVWQNMTLLAKTMELLQADGFGVYVHCLVPANDGGIALGQAVVGARQGGS